MKIDQNKKVVAVFTWSFFKALSSSLMRMKVITFAIPFNIDSLSKLRIEAENFKREVDNFYAADESIFLRILSKTFSFVMELPTRF